MPETPYFENTNFECTIKDFMATTDGKMPSSGSQRQIIMEYGPWWELLYNKLPTQISEMSGGIPAEFTAWFNTTTTAYSFASLLVMTLPSPRYEYY